MAKKSKRNAFKEKYWRAMLDDWKQSGMTIASYCREKDLKQVNFHFWRREIFKRDQESACSQTVRVTEAITVPFTEVSIPKHTPGGIEVIVSGDHRIVVHPGFDGDSFMRVVDLLARVSC